MSVIFNIFDHILAYLSAINYVVFRNGVLHGTLPGTTIIFIFIYLFIERYQILLKFTRHASEAVGWLSKMKIG